MLHQQQFRLQISQPHLHLRSKLVRYTMPRMIGDPSKSSCTAILPAVIATMASYSSSTHSWKEIRRLVETELEGHPEVDPCGDSIPGLEDHLAESIGLSRPPP